MGTIAEKLSYLADTKVLFKDRLNSLGAEIIESTTFRNYLIWLDTFYNQSSDKTDLAKNGVVGRTSQNSTTGKNILPQDKYIASRTINGITYTNNGDGTFDLNGTATANTSLRIIDVGIFNLESGQRYYLYSSVAYSSTTFNMSIVTTESGTRKFLIANGNYTPSTTPTSSRLQFYIASGDTVNVQNVKLMLVKGADDTSYEPYTNGASPNPDYPQEINNLSGDVEYKVRGKNLCNGINQNVYLNNNVNQCGIASNNSGLYISVNGGNYTISSSTTQARYRIACCNDIPTTLVSTAYKGQNKDNTNNSITIDTTGYSYLIVNATDLNAIMINEGSTALPYESYISESFPLSLGDIELCAISDYKDRIYSQNGKFYLEKKNGKVVLDGSESDWRKHGAYGTPTYYLYYADNLFNGLTDITSRFGYGYALYFKWVYGTEADNINYSYIRFQYNNGTRVYIGFPNDLSLADFKSWLTTHNTIVYYVLATPTTTEITEENYPTLYSQLLAIQEFLTKYKINKEFLLDYSSPEIEY